MTASASEPWRRGAGLAPAAPSARVGPGVADDSGPVRTEEPAESPAGQGPSGTAPSSPAVENRWWVETTSAKRPLRAASAATSPVQRVAGERLFGVGRDFDQDRARAHLTDSNLHWLRKGNPPENGWAYLPSTETQSRADAVARVKQVVRLPQGARGVIVDAGNSLRVILTGSPVGECVVELRLGSESSIDVWVRGEWVVEQVFRGRDRALREAAALLARCLATSG